MKFEWNYHYKTSQKLRKPEFSDRIFGNFQNFPKAPRRFETHPESSKRIKIRTGLNMLKQGQKLRKIYGKRLGETRSIVW